MEFEPIGERHAIQNVIFTLVFDEPFTELDIGRISQGSLTTWRPFLPKEERPQIFQMSFGEPPTGTKTPPPPASINYSRMNPNGNMGWQLSFDQNQVSVVCSSYTRWDSVWGTAKSLLQDALTVVANDKRKLTHLSLQISDSFVWKGNPADMSADKLFKTDGDFFPKTVSNFGPFWHLHNGYFQQIDFENGEPLNNTRTLNRIHIDSVNQNDRSFVGVNHTLRTDITLPSLVVAKAADMDYLEVVFSKLHTMNKDALAGLLTDDMQGKISLNA